MLYPSKPHLVRQSLEEHEVLINVFKKSLKGTITRAQKLRKVIGLFQQKCSKMRAEKGKPLSFMHCSS
jgi:hypothetical protein